MADLKQDWLTDGYIDFEYKRYLLLAYLQEVDHEFGAKRLYPNLSKLVEHYRNLEILREQKRLTLNSFPKEISRLDFERFQIAYKQLFQDDEAIKEIDEIIAFALPELGLRVSAGREIYEEVEDKVDIFPVGVMPLHVDEGYFLISDFLRRAINAYYYNITIFENAAERFRGIHATLIGSYDLTIANTYQHIKYQLTQGAKDMPAMYALEFKESFPLDETMLPVAKRMLVRYVSAA